MVLLLPPSLFFSMTGVYFGVTTKTRTSSFAGKLDFGIGMKSLFVQLLGRKWEDGCSARFCFFLFDFGGSVADLELSLFSTVVDFVVVEAIVVGVVEVILLDVLVDVLAVVAVTCPN